MKTPPYIIKVYNPCQRMLLLFNKFSNKPITGHTEHYFFNTLTKEVCVGSRDNPKHPYSSWASLNPTLTPNDSIMSRREALDYLRTHFNLSSSVVDGILKKAKTGSIRDEDLVMKIIDYSISMPNLYKNKIYLVNPKVFQKQFIRYLNIMDSKK